MIYGRYAELWLKSEVSKKRFLKALKEHISLFAENIKIKRDRVEVEGMRCKKALAFIPGIEYWDFVERYSFNNLEDIKEIIFNNYDFKEFKSFGVRVKRKGEHKFKSQDVAVYLGKEIKERYGLEVNLTNPDLWINIRIEDKEFYLIKKRIKGMAGLPYATEGKVKVNNNNYYLILELIKRGLYVENIDEKLRKLYPLKQIEQDFEVLVYDYGKEKIKDVIKNEKLKLYPLIYLEQKEIEKRDKEVRDKIKEVLNCIT